MFGQICEQQTERCRSSEAVRDVTAGKTAPASLMQFSAACINGTCSRLECVCMSVLDRNAAAMKPYSSAPNIDLLCHTEAHRVPRPNKAEDIPQQNPVGVDKPRDRCIPEIVIVCSSEDVASEVETCSHAQEPDIVQSTKSGSLPRHDVVQTAQPIAPPRKKKFKTPSPSSVDAAHEVRW